MAPKTCGDEILKRRPGFCDVELWFETRKDLEKDKDLSKVMMEALVKTGLVDGEGGVLVKEEDCDVKVQAGINSIGGMGKKTVFDTDGLHKGVAEGRSVKSASPAKWPTHTYPENVYPREGVEVERDFPPFCGRNAPKPTDEELFRINGNNNSGVDEVGAVGMGNGMSKDAMERGLKKRPLSNDGSLGYELNKEVHVGGRTTMPDWLSRKGKGNTRKVKRHPLFIKRAKSRERKICYGGKSLKETSLSAGDAAYVGVHNRLFRNEDDYGADSEDQNDDSEGPCSINVSLPPFGPKDSSDARNKVRETLRLFQAACRKLLQGEEAKLRPAEELNSRKHKVVKRIDLAADKYIKSQGKYVNRGKEILGAVPGIEVGDEFQYRVELAIVGVHRLYQGGIDYKKHNGEIVATSIVASGGYDDELGNPDVLIYSGQGGNGGVIDKHKPAEDQKLERGNLALKNSISAKTPVRVIRGSKEIKAAESSYARAKTVMSYVYDGLYMVVDYKQVPGPRENKLVFKFELRRISGQPELSWKKVKKAMKFKTREGLCVADISGGRELLPICAVNTINNEKPPEFIYIARMKYPNRYRPTPSSKGCHCRGMCLDFEKCSCAIKNGGEVPIIPYNHDGAIVEPKTLVYECGPHCKCPPSCYNRVTQHGIKIPLEIFKTESKGWGVRSLNFIPSGSFICEYTGELLEDNEAEKRVGFDEYLFDIGQNYKDCCPDSDEKTSSRDEEDSFCIDAFKYGNVGRFINHSCSPNLYAQNVLYDHSDKRKPHIMLFAAENIPPLQELTYHYNFVVDTIHDSHGNVKKKSCFCGSNQCNGRLY